MLVLNTVLALLCALGTLGLMVQLGMLANLFVIQEQPDAPAAALLDAPAGVAEMVVSADGARLQTWHRGSGRPVVLLHDLGLSAAAMGPLWAALAARGYRVIALDWRGHGSSPAAGPLTLDQFTADLAAVVAHYDLRDALLVGHSLGALLALRYLTTEGAQDRIGGLLSVAGFAGGQLRGLPGRQWERQLLKWNILPRLLRHRLYAWSYATPLFGDRINPTWVRAYLELLLARPLRRLHPLLHELAQTDLYPQLDRVKIPVTVTCSRQDQRTRPLHAVRLARHLPAATLQWIEDGSGNMLIWECPQRLAEMVRALDQQTPVALRA